MKNAKILEMINNGQIEELKSAIQDEIYRDTLSDISNAKKRYKAMKLYLKYNTSLLHELKHPCRIIYNAEPCTAFCNEKSFVVTTETSGTLELTDDDEIFCRLLQSFEFTNYSGQLNFARILADAKSKGYSLKASSIWYSRGNFPSFYIRHGAGYFTVGLTDLCYSIIADGKNCRVYHDKNDKRGQLQLNNEVGMCVVMPVMEPTYVKYVIDLEDYLEDGKE